MLDRDSIYTELFHTYHQSLINFCVSKGVRPENVEDIVSEAFTRALAKADQVMPLEPKQQRAWLYSAVAKIIKETNAKAKPAAFSEIENDVSSGTVRVMVSRLRKKLRVIVNKVLSNEIHVTNGTLTSFIDRR